MWFYCSGEEIKRGHLRCSFAWSASSGSRITHGWGICRSLMDFVLILTAGCSDVFVEGRHDTCMFTQHTCCTLMAVFNDFTTRRCKNTHRKFSLGCIYVRQPVTPPALQSRHRVPHMTSPRDWGLDELWVSAIIEDWSQMCCTPINGSDYQGARLRNTQIKFNKRDRF